MALLKLILHTEISVLKYGYSKAKSYKKEFKLKRVKKQLQENHAAVEGANNVTTKKNKISQDDERP